MKVYAVADVVPPECDYITAGKEYEVGEEDAYGFEFYNNDGEGQFDLWEKGLHLNGNNWRRVEREE